MTTNTTSLKFITQRPREDGCGAVVLQMLSGLPYDEIAARIGWREGELRRSTWTDILRILGELGWKFGEPLECNDWDEIRELAVVHVKDDHFMLYDGIAGVFYDPWEYEGPQETSSRIPMTYLPVIQPS